MAQLSVITLNRKFIENNKQRANKHGYDENKHGYNTHINEKGSSMQWHHQWLLLVVYGKVYKQPATSIRTQFV